MGWYEGPTLLHHLETVYVSSDPNLIDVRFPVQYVIRPISASTTTIAATPARSPPGAMRPGDEVVVLPSGMTSRIASIDTFDGPLEEARPPQAVVADLADDVDITRGDMICRPHNQPTPSQDLDAMIAWMDSNGDPLARRQIYALKHTHARRCGRWSPTCSTASTSHDAPRRGRPVARANEVGRVTLRTMAPIFADDYRRNRNTGSFILIDESTNQTVAGGMIRTSS